MKDNNINSDNINGENIVECECKHVHQDVVDKVRGDMPEEDKLVDLAELFKVLGDPTRVKIIFLLFKEEMCVCDIAESISMTQSAISHQLRVLKQARLVKFRKEGKVVFYSLDDDHISKIFDCGLHHIEEMYKR
ncbi:ArsR/SmtB family transcription factor [Intestinibacter sp.]